MTCPWCADGEWSEMEGIEMMENFKWKLDVKMNENWIESNGNECEIGWGMSAYCIVWQCPWSV